MLVEEITVNVGESQTIYIQVHSSETPEDELRYGDVKFNADEAILLWYGNDDTAMTGWCNPPWETNGISNAIIKNIRGNRKHESDCIYRILNNDPSFDEDEYKKSLGVTYEH